VKIKNIFFDKKIISLVIIFLVLLGLLFGIYFFFNKKPQTSPQVYKGSTFEIAVPEGWSVATSTAYSDFTVISQDKNLKATRNVLSSNEPIIFLSTKNIGTTTLENFIKEIKYNLVPVSYRYSYNNYEILEEATTTLMNNNQAYIIGTHFEVMNSGLNTNKDIFLNNLKNSSTTTIKKPEIIKYRNLSLIVIKDEKLYVVTAMAQEEKWSSLENKFREVLINFNL